MYLHLFLGVGQEFVQRGVKQTYSQRQTIHRPVRNGYIAYKQKTRHTREGDVV